MRVNLMDQGRLALVAGFLAANDERPNNERSEALGSQLKHTYDFNQIVDPRDTTGRSTPLPTALVSLRSRKSWESHQPRDP